MGDARRDRARCARPPVSPRQGSTLGTDVRHQPARKRAATPRRLQSYRWLAAQGYETPSIFVVHGSRGKIASALALDVLVDDRPENCLDVAIDSAARAILVWRGEEGKIPGSARQLGIGSVSSVGECLDILESLDRPARRPKAPASSSG